MRVLLLINSMGAGGAERSTLELAKYLQSERVDVLLVCLLKGRVLVEDEVKSSGVPSIILKSGNIVSRYFQMKEILKKFPADIIHSVLFEANILLRFLKIFNPSLRAIESIVSTSYVKERTADRNITGYKFALVKQFDLFTARIARPHFHTISNIVYEAYKSLYNIRSGGHTLIYRGRRVNDKLVDRDSIRKELALQDLFVLVNVGRHEFAKGQIVILKALDVLRNKGFDLNRLKLIILGREGYYSSELFEYVKKHQLEKQVVFAGFRNDVDRFLAAGDAFVFPSYYEGLGGSLIEGLASSLPIICSDLPVFKEVLRSDEAALFFESGNAEMLAACIIRLIDDPALQSKLSSHGFRRYQEAFRLEKIHHDMLEMYKRVSNSTT